MDRMVFKLDNEKKWVYLHFSFLKNYGTNFVSGKVLKMFNTFLSLLILGWQAMPDSEAMRQVKKQHFKVKFWNWGPIIIWNKLKCVHIFLSQKSLHPILQF